MNCSVNGLVISNISKTNLPASRGCIIRNLLIMFDTYLIYVLNFFKNYTSLNA